MRLRPCDRRAPKKGDEFASLNPSNCIWRPGRARDSITDWRASSRGLVALRDFDPALPPLRVISTGPYRSRARVYVRTTPESYRNSADRVGRQWWARRKARLCPPYHSIRAGRAVDAIGRADPNRSTFANHVLRSRCAGREYDGTSPRSTRFSVGTGSSWDAEYNLCVVQLVTSVQLATCNL